MRPNGQAPTWCRCSPKWSPMRCRCSCGIAAAASIRPRYPAIRKGLAESVRARMARRGGSATVRSAPGQGTEVSLSHAEDRRRQAAEAAMTSPGPVSAASASSASGGKPRVFLVDDHGMFRAGVRSELAGTVDIVGEAADVAPAIARITAVSA